VGNPSGAQERVDYRDGRAQKNVVDIIAKDID
jgi:hypothetical protein